jgi:UDP-N-acetylglucosamine 4-epimerase
MDNFSTGKRENIEGFLHNKNFTLIEDDIRNLEACLVACEGVDYVLHQAAWGSVPRSIEMPLLYEEINIRGTLNMMEAGRQHIYKYKGTGHTHQRPWQYLNPALPVPQQLFPD